MHIVAVETRRFQGTHAPRIRIIIAHLCSTWNTTSPACCVRMTPYCRDDRCRRVTWCMCIYDHHLAKYDGRWRHPKILYTYMVSRAPSPVELLVLRARIFDNIMLFCNESRATCRRSRDAYSTGGRRRVRWTWTSWLQIEKRRSKREYRHTGKQRETTRCE